MKHVFKKTEKGAWSQDGVSYDVKCIRLSDAMPKGYVDSLEAALKKKSTVKVDVAEVASSENG
jgi:hypothetical protein